jgi:hypothetical protein
VRVQDLKFVMPGLVPGIHVYGPFKEDVDGRGLGSPFSERLCPAMTEKQFNHRKGAP